MKFFVSLFRFIGWLSVLSYLICYSLEYRDWEDFAMAAAIISFTAMLVVKLYWFYQLNLQSNTPQKESAGN